MRPGRRRTLLFTAGALLFIGALFLFSWTLGIQGDPPISIVAPTPTSAPAEGTVLLHARGTTTVPGVVGDALGVSWKGELCMAGTNINTDKVRGNCAKGAVSKRFCDKLAKAAAGEVCGQYAEGKFAPSSQLTTAALTTTYTRLWKTSGVSSVFCVIGGKFKFDKSLQLSHTPAKGHGCGDGRLLLNLSPIHVVALLHQLTMRTPTRRGILFSGDSMMRQLFLGVVSLVRGTTVVSEHYFHQDGLYLLHMDGRDEIVVLTPSNKQKYASIIEHYFKGYQPGGGDGDGGTVQVAMMFMWDIKPSTYRREAVTTMAPHLSTHIASFMYWWNNKGRLEEIEPYLSTVKSNLLSSEADADTGLLYRFVNTPWTAPKTFGGVDDAVREPRNKRVGEWADGLMSDLIAQARHAPVVVDYAAIANGTRAISKTKDGIHYGCIWTPKYPEQVSGQKDNGRGCTDPMNTAVVRWLLQTLFLRG